MFVMKSKLFLFVIFLFGFGVFILTQSQSQLKSEEESVAENVEYYVKNSIDPVEIRNGFLKLALPQKESVQDLVDSIAGKKVYLPHKLNIRCRLLPHTKLLHGIRRK